MTTPRLYRFMAGWPVASMLTELARMGVYDDEIAEFLAVEAPHLAGDPGARFAVIASRRIGPLIRRSVVAEILARRPHPPWTPPTEQRETPGMPSETHEFVILIATPDGRELAAADIDALYEAGLSDAGISTGPGCTLADFSREAPSRDEAVTSAAADIRKVAGLRPVLVIEGGTLTAVTPS
jgi:hypothetical protein